MFSNNTFCSMSFSSIEILPSGDFRVCCFSGSKHSFNRTSEYDNYGVAVDDNNVTMNIMTHSIKEALNSKIHKEIRLAQSLDVRHPECLTCWNKDDSNSKSYRAQKNEVFLDYDNAISIEKASEFMSADGSIDNMPCHLDIRFGNLCNAKCIHCEPQHSNLWYEDHIRIYRKNYFQYGEKKYKIRSENGILKSDVNEKKWWETETWWNQFEQILPHLREIYVTGGEPFLVPAHDEMLDRIIAAGLTDKIKLIYDTNLSIINLKIINRLKQFKSVKISASLEDTNDRYELIRFPLKFDKFVSNLKQMENSGIKISNLTSCIGIYSATAATRIVPYFANIGNYNHPYRILRSPQCYDLKHLPKKEKLKIIETLDNANIGDKNKRMIIKYLQNNMDQESIPKLQEFVRRMDILDKSRKTDWKSVFPEVAEMVQPYV